MLRLNVYTTNGIEPDEVFEGTARQIYYTATHIIRRNRHYALASPYMWCSNVKLHCALLQRRVQLYFGYFDGGINNVYLERKKEDD